MNKRIFPVLFLLVAVSLLAAACSPTAVPAQPTMVPTQAVDLAATAEVLRTEVAATIASDMTSTAMAMPTATTPPTNTPEPPTATPAPTLTVALASPTAIPTIRIITTYPTFTPTPGPYQCQITAISPAYGAKLGPRAEFDARWTIKNTGTKDWDDDAVDYLYVSGTKMQKRGDSFDLDQGLDTGKTIDIIVDMVAPNDLGFYHADWSVRYNGQTMCTLPVDIWVVNQ